MNATAICSAPSPFAGIPGAPSSSVASSLRASRRGTSRREVVLPCQAVREHDFTLVAERTLDISIDGVLLPVRRPILTGEPVIVSFAIPGMWIDAEGTVARVVHGRRPGDDGLAVGVLFDRITPSARAALAAFLHGRTPPLPRRGPLARVRRGQQPPRLADETAMQTMVDVAVSPVGSDEGGEAAPRSDGNASGDAAAVDGLGILQAVVDAWRSLTVDNDAPSED